MAIRKLPQEIYMKIAAGEVVTSAGSVVKELIENALDSGACSVKLEIKNGGKDAIKVSDNGSGIPGEELSLAVHPHATSKIQQWDDILDLDTFGFRGEALSSIASVSEFYISSITREEDVGTSLYFRGGQLMEEKRLPMNTGTTIEVRNLFFNVPARRKFLKTSSSESRYVLEVLEKFLLARPDVAFELIRDGNVVFQCPKESLQKRIQKVLKVDEPDNLLEVNHQQGNFSVNGAISSPQHSRPNMTGITAFVNERYVKDPIVYAAVRDFFTPILGKGRYPIAVLFMRVPKSEVDINVHPQKLEVKYSQSGAIYSLIKNALKSTFSDHSMQIRDDFSALRQTNQRDTVKTKEDSTVRAYKEVAYVNDTQRPSYTTSQPLRRPNSFAQTEPIINQLHYKRQTENHKQPVFSTDKIIGIANKRYIILEDATGLLFIDFHAAHERILYEKIKKQEKKLQIQQLLEPIQLEIDLASIQILQDRHSTFAQLGFDYKLSEQKAHIKGIPNLIRQQDAREVFKEIIDELRLTDLEKESEVYDNIYATIACHNAFRTGDFITLDQAEDLIKEMKTYDVFSCPHGRPVKYRLPFSQLDAFFKRS